MKIKKPTIALAILLLVSFFSRIYKINNLSLFGDEIDVGYQAYSLLKTGKDYRGTTFPVYINSLSESRAPLLIYASIPGIKLFGLNELGVRITPIIFGVLSIYLFYKLIFLLSKSNALAFLSSSILAFSSWHFHYSRNSFEITLLISLFLAATYFFYKFTQNNKNIFIFLSIILFGLTFYTYNTANIITPLLVIFLIANNLKKVKTWINIKNLAITSALTLLIIIPIINQIFFGKAAERFSSLNIFNDSQIISDIIEKRTSFSATTASVEAIFHNKPIYWSKEITKNYLSSLSPSFLFLTGDKLNVRHNLPGFGLLFISLFPVFIVGFFSLDVKQKANQLMIFWLLISPIASSLTINGGTHATRLFPMLIPISYFIAQGVTKCLKSKYFIPQIFLILLAISFVIESSLYSHEYFTHYSKDFPNDWDYGYKEIFSNIPINSSNRIFISNTRFNSLLPFLFYQKISPNQNIQIDDHQKENIIDNMSGFKISDQIFFINNWQHVVNDYNEIFNKINQIAQSGDTFVLFQLNEIPGDINLSQKPREGFKTIKTIYNPNKTILAQIIQKI